MHILVTGANGFVGSALCRAIAESGHTVSAALRVDGPIPAGATRKIVVGDIAGSVDWDTALTGVEVVMHCAARAHVLHDSAENADLYLSANLNATQRLAAAAARSGVRRFVYLSSIKVNGEETVGHAYTPGDPPAPQDPYGRSKLLAEQALLALPPATSMEVAIVRPPLVYGPGVRANFLRLMRWVDGGWPLPLGAVHNRRSLVSVWNLCDLLVRLAGSAVPPGRVWLVSDGDDLSTPELIRRIAVAMGRKARLIPVPVSLLRGVARLAGKRDEVTRLCGSLRVDISQTTSALGWVPPIQVSESLARTAAWYRSRPGPR